MAGYLKSKAKVNLALRHGEDEFFATVKLKITSPCGIEVVVPGVVVV